MAREAKKDPQDLSIEEKLKNLYQLQSMLTEIDKIKTLRGELPLEVQDLEDEIEGLTTRIERIQADMAALQEEISRRRVAIQDNNANIERYTNQLDNVRNNREYENLTKEIEYLQLDNQLNEKKIREAQAANESKQEEIRRCSDTVTERRDDLDVKKSELDEIISETRAEEEKLRERSKNLEVITASVASATKYSWLEFDAQTLSGKFLNMPLRADIPENINEQLIVDLYSK